MLSLSPANRIFLCLSAVDLRKSFDGLSALVRQALGNDPLSGQWFVFRNHVGIASRSWPGRRMDGVCGISASKKASLASQYLPAMDHRVWRFALPSWPCSWMAWC
jgi:transposase